MLNTDQEQYPFLAATQAFDNQYAARTAILDFREARARLRKRLITALVVLVILCVVATLWTLWSEQEVGEEEVDGMFPRQLWWESLVDQQSLVHVQGCENTVQGRYLIADDRGYVCPVALLNTSSGCCTLVDGGSDSRNANETTVLHDCSSCNTTERCCEVYEHCVSCCIAHQDVDSLAAALNRSVAAVSGLNRFWLCSVICRTSSKSVFMQDPYRASYLGVRLHHCYVVDPP